MKGNVDRPAPSGEVDRAGGRSSRTRVPPRWISERRTIKVLVEPQGAIISVTTKTYSYLFIVSRGFVGRKKILTKDRIVARAGYCTPRVLRLIEEVYPNGP